MTWLATALPSGNAIGLGLSVGDAGDEGLIGCIQRRHLAGIEIGQDGMRRGRDRRIG